MTEFDLRRISKKESLIVIVILIVLFYLFANFWRIQLENYVSSLGLFPKLLVYFLFFYGLTVFIYYKATKDISKTIQLSIILLFIVDLTLNLNSAYSKDGFGSKIKDDSILSVDRTLGEVLEERIYQCSSFKPESNGLFICSPSQTGFIYNLLYVIIPSGFLLLLAAFDRKIINILITRVK